MEFYIFRHSLAWLGYGEVRILVVRSVICWYRMFQINISRNIIIVEEMWQNIKVPNNFTSKSPTILVNKLFSTLSFLPIRHRVLKSIMSGLAHAIISSFDYL